MTIQTYYAHMDDIFRFGFPRLLPPRSLQMFEMAFQQDFDLQKYFALIAKSDAEINQIQELPLRQTFRQRWIFLVLKLADGIQDTYDHLMLCHIALMRGDSDQATVDVADMLVNGLLPEPHQKTVLTKEQQDLIKKKAIERLLQLDDRDLVRLAPNDPRQLEEGRLIYFVANTILQIDASPVYRQAIANKMFQMSEELQLPWLAKGTLCYCAAMCEPCDANKKKAIALLSAWSDELETKDSQQAKHFRHLACQIAKASFQWDAVPTAC